MVGFVVGMIRMGLDFARRAPYCGSGEEDTRFEIVSKVDFLHFAIILAGVSTIAMVVISLFTVPRDDRQVFSFVAIIFIFDKRKVPLQTGLYSGNEIKKKLQ